jgi:transcriptional regulator with XRE-family HTH domain
MKRANTPRNSFSTALKKIRVAKKLSQEDFSLISSRTYVSSLERGIYSPTLSKVDELAEVLNVHPLVLLTLSYVSNSKPGSVSAFVEKLRCELAAFD